LGGEKSADDWLHFPTDIFGCSVTKRMKFRAPSVRSPAAILVHTQIDIAITPNLIPSKIVQCFYLSCIDLLTLSLAANRKQMHKNEVHFSNKHNKRQHNKAGIFICLLLNSI